MANRFCNPDVAFFTSAGAALSGAQLFFYATGTSTKQNTYSDSALSVANANPVVLDSNGRSGSIFLQNLKYKVVLAPSTDTDPPTSPIWTMDPVYASDVSTLAQVQTTAGNPNGQLAGTQGSPTVPASVDWDRTNNILYVCTVTGNATGATWTAVNPSTSTTTPVPQGRLTLSTNVPVISSDVTAATSVYYTPYVGLLVPIYNGTSFISNSIVSQLTLGLVAAHAANNIYDLYVFLSGGTAVTLGSSPSWSAGTGGSITAGSCARGTGAGGAALSNLNGTLTNAASMTMTYGPSGATTAVSANQATYLGTMYIDGVNGQVSDHISYGRNRKRGLWNFYNRVPVSVIGGDPAASWSYTSATVRASNNVPTSFTATAFNQSSGTACNGMTVLQGVAEDAFDIEFVQYVSNSGSSAASQIGVGFNSTSVFSGTISQTVSGAASAIATNYLARQITSPLLGINVLVPLESANTAGGGTFSGTQSQMLFKTSWRA